MSEARTEEATPRHEQRARERGRAWQSRDLTFGAVLLGAAGLVRLGAGSTRDAWQALFARSLDLAEAPGIALERSLLAGAQIALPLLVAIVVIGASVSALQLRGLFAPGAIAPDGSRLDPSSRFGDQAASSSAARSLLGLARIALVLSIGMATWIACMPGIATLSRQAPDAAFDACITVIVALASRIGLALLAFGVLDAIVERALYRASLKMTRRERERDRRDAEGDVHLRRERERVRDELHREGDLEEARAATLVVVGEGLAVALGYDETDPDAVPRALAIARGSLAEEIARQARDHGTKIAVDDALAAQLAILPPGGFIGEALYEPVARAMSQGAAS